MNSVISGKDLMDESNRKQSRSGSNGEDEDHISRLPEDILGQILFDLTTKEAAQLRVMSKFWWKNCTLVPYVFTSDSNFTCSKLGFSSWRQFDSDITRKAKSLLLSLTTDDSKEKTNHVCEWIRAPTPITTTWISHLLTCKGELVILVVSQFFPDYNFRFRDSFLTLPEHLCNNTLLKKLDIWLPYILRASPHTLFPNLTTLHLYQIEIQSENPDVDTLRFSLENLNTLDIYDCKWLNMKCVEFYVPNLVRFQTRTTYEVVFDDYTIKIIGAKLIRFLAIRGNLHNIDVTGSRVLSANLGLDTHSEELELQALKMLKGFTSVEKLEMSYFIMKTIGHSSKSGLPLLEFNGLKHLILSQTPDVSLLIEILNTMPFLKSLGIGNCMEYTGQEKYSNDEDNSSMDCVPFCFMHSLEMVKLWIYSTSELQLAKYVLKNGVKLKEALFCITKVSDVRSEIRTFAIGSPHLELFFRDY